MYFWRSWKLLKLDPEDDPFLSYNAVDISTSDVSSSLLSLKDISASKAILRFLSSSADFALLFELEKRPETLLKTYYCSFVALIFDILCYYIY